MLGPVFLRCRRAKPRHAQLDSAPTTRHVELDSASIRAGYARRKIRISAKQFHGQSERGRKLFCAFCIMRKGTPSRKRERTKTRKDLLEHPSATSAPPQAQDGSFDFPPPLTQYDDEALFRRTEHGTSVKCCSPVAKSEESRARRHREGG